MNEIRKMNDDEIRSMISEMENELKVREQKREERRLKKQKKETANSDYQREERKLNELCENTPDNYCKFDNTYWHVYKNEPNGSLLHDEVIYDVSNELMHVSIKTGIPGFSVKDLTTSKKKITKEEYEKVLRKAENHLRKQEEENVLHDSIFDNLVKPKHVYDICTSPFLFSPFVYKFGLFF